MNAYPKIEDFAVASGSITYVEWIDQGFFQTESGEVIPELPPFFRVVVNLKPALSSNLNMELWLPRPEDWNGRFLGTGNGGGAGLIRYDLLPVGLRRGFAAANTDLGTSPDANEMISYPERQKDFGYRGTHAMTEAAKSIIEQFYRRPARYAYYAGGSTGGQQGLVEAQRYPGDYNGIIVGAPANNRTHIHMMFLWNLRAMRTGDGSLMFSQETLNRITETVVEHYREASGGAPGDPFLTDPASCQVDLRILTPLGLSERQMEALRKVYSGPVNPRTGKRIYSPILPGSECFALGLFWQQDAGRLAPEQFYPFKWAFGADFDDQKFDFDKDVDILDERLAGIMNANDPNLEAFRNKGGKLILYAGTTDPGVPYPDAVHYYERVAALQGGLTETQSFFRFFLVPGLTHITGGPGLNDIGLLPSKEVPMDAEHNVLTALMEWVEDGRAPERLIATAYHNIETCEGIPFQRPIYPYPLFPQYAGGDVNHPDSYRPAPRERDSGLHADSIYLK